MKNACLVAPGLGRHCARASLVALAFVGIAGCGGSVSGGDCSWFSNNIDHCFSTVGAGTFAVAFVSPQEATVQVGGTVTFTGGSTGVSNPAYQWKRSSDGGKTYTDIAGATASSYTIAGAQLPDDGAIFRLTVHGSAGEQATAFAAGLRVSSMPPVLFQDGEFLPGDWSASALASPTPAGPTHDEAQAAAGGNPGAYRTMTHHMSAGPSSLTVFHASAAATYDPASKGAIYSIDYSADCSQPDRAATSFQVVSNLLIEQGGRKYATGLDYCFAAGWSASLARSSLVAASFVLVDGLQCNAGEACPDFSATAPPLHFGSVRSSIAASGVDAGSTVHGIDNWKVAVWRR